MLFFGNMIVDVLPQWLQKIAHQYCQDQWGRQNSVQPYNVLYALCRDHHPQYCRFIEEMREDIGLQNSFQCIEASEKAFR